MSCVRDNHKQSRRPSEHLGLNGWRVQLTMCWSVAWPSNPPKVTLGVKVARYRKMTEATHWMWSESLKSLAYQGSFRFTSATSPPNNLMNRRYDDYQLYKLSHWYDDYQHYKRSHWYDDYQHYKQSHWYDDYQHYKQSHWYDDYQHYKQSHWYDDYQHYKRSHCKNAIDPYFIMWIS